MTMLDDQDQQRAHLYSLIFRPLGQRHFEQIDRVTDADISVGVPEYIRAIFSEKEILGLLETIALSALHAQAHKLVRWAWRTAHGYINELAPLKKGDLPSKEREALMSRAARVLCCACDMAILRGQPISSRRSSVDDGDSMGHERTLLRIRHHMAHEFPVLEAARAGGKQAVLEKMRTSDNHQFALNVAWVRLLVRDAELTALTGNVEGAIETFDMVFEIEEEFARHSRAAGATVLSGRPARVALKLMLRADGYYRINAGPRTARWQLVDTRIRGMIHSGVTRLSKYNGAERLAMLLDRSRYHFVLGHNSLKKETTHWGRSLNYAVSARQASSMGQISHGMQMQVLTHFVAIAIETARHVASANKDALTELGLSSAKELLEMAYKDADAVYRTAKALKFKPQEGIALYLRSRVGVLQSDHTSVPKKANWTQDLLKDVRDAQQIMLKCADNSFKNDMIEIEVDLHARREAEQRSIT